MSVVLLKNARGKLHTESGVILLRNGCKQVNIWEGRIDLHTGQVDYISLINTRPECNNSQEISDLSIRQKMFEIIQKVSEKYVK